MLSRDQLLEELGLGPVWKLRSYRGALLAGDRANAEAGRSRTAEGVDLEPAQARPLARVAPHAKTEVAAPAQRQAASPLASGPLAAQWAELNADIATCRACGLCQSRQQTVPGVGAARADWLLVGEAPGAEEDESGEPFVGPAGKLLDAMLTAIDLQRAPGGQQQADRADPSSVFITNAVKCRPPDRAPSAAEMAACKPFLERQIALVQPRLIVLFGRAAAHAVLGADQSLSSLRGERHVAGEIPVLVTYHPAYLLRAPTDKAKAWEDLCAARRLMRTLSA